MTIAGAHPLLRWLRGVAVVGAIALVAAVSTAGAASAAARPSTGVVVINTNLSYSNGAAAGTGMVISSSGEVLTNNHVIRGATSITVTVPDTGRKYKATVAGYAIGADVAVLKLAKASDLATVSLGNAAGLVRGSAVTAVGNAGGTGTLVTSSGTVTALGQSITIGDDTGGTTRLTGLIQTDANLRPGDSGGPLLNAAGRVIGIDTAASAGYTRSGSSEGYAIPINRALAIAKQIRTGRSSATVHVGETAFLGILAEPARYNDVAGALVRRVVTGSPAAKAGLAPGDVITKSGGRAVTNTQDIVRALQARHPGNTISVTWTGQDGIRTTAAVKLAIGPPQ